MAFELKFEIELAKQKGNFRALLGAQSLRRFAKLSRAVHGSCFWEAPERREREKTHMTQRAIASRATFIVFLYMWHGLACFGQWKGCSRVFFCLVSSYRHAAFLLAALGRPFCFFCFLFPFSLSFLSLSAVLSADSAGCGRIGTAAAVHLMKRAPGPLEVRQGVASYSD